MTVLAKQHVYPGHLEKVYATFIDRARKANLVNEIIRKNPAVFRKRQKAKQKVILNRLGWIDVVNEMPSEIRRIERLVQEVKDEGICHVFVLGMGGSSLCPEVFGRLFGKKNWLKSFTIVDTTAPSQLEAIIQSTDFRKAFFIVSSKSGSTIETVSQFRFFFKLVKDLRPLKAGQYFAAITDEDSDLHRIARRNRFREIFLNRKDIGGRYSALSFFGLVPGAFTKLDLTGLLNGAMERLEYMKAHGNDCDALHLGTLIGAGGRSGHDKLRFRTTETVAPFVAWIEQLVAESTGKELKGIIPLDGGTDGSAIADDMIDVYYSMRGERLGGIAGATPADPGRPYVVIEMPDPVSIGSEMLKWEMATAVASTVLGVNPFDEPNVAESKRNTESILHGRRGPRKVIEIIPLARWGDIDIVSATGVAGLVRRRNSTPEEVLKGFFTGVSKSDYVSILCYTETDPQIERRLVKLRQVIETAFSLTTLRGYGPRFLHSTGQLFKGGSQKGHFLVLERDFATDYDIPNFNISFGRLIKAQIQGDIKALRRRKRPVININLKLNPVPGLDQLIQLVESLATK